ncbi:MAG: hypothetical protein M5R41_13970 [Bacteroidia bacterium]|nr:hypothetical protein [Bacteroidia bacterium]
MHTTTHVTTNRVAGVAIIAGRCLLLACLLFLMGCAVSHDTTKRSELYEMRGVGPLRALTIDSRLYTFEKFSFDDSTLHGSGTLRRDGVTRPFDGSVRFDSIAFLEREESSFLQGAWVVPMAVFVAGGLLTLSSPPIFSIHYAKSSSCPFVYSWDGVDYTLDTEVFGTSVSKAMEARTYSILPSLVTDGGVARIRVSNERPETHMINDVKLYAADMERYHGCALDTENRLWPLPAALAPVAARDHSGRDVLADVARPDKHYWVSDLAGGTVDKGFRDMLEMEFAIAPEAREATLVVDAINTELIFQVYRSIGGILGDATLDFYQALETDEDLQRCVNDWLTDCGLAVEVFDGSSWTHIDRILPEANVAPFRRALRVALPEGTDGMLRVRLSTLTDVWRIDAVTLDASPVETLQMHELPMTAADGSRGNDMRQLLADADSRYAVLLPPEHVDIAFDASQTASMRAPVYIVSAQGYLYEWFPTQEDGRADGLTASLHGRERIALLKSVLEHKEAFLPPIYRELTKTRNRE